MSSSNVFLQIKFWLQLLTNIFGVLLIGSNWRNSYLNEIVKYIIGSSVKDSELVWARKTVRDDYQSPDRIDHNFA